MNIIDSMIQEYQQECATTRKVLERVPTEHFGWKP
ncbi:MAG: DinB family protein, partial [Candidatus Hydrogenedentes bacterium]|nr:DinB family protein [Candidatus Hydrogenedentota bacterium]